MKKLMFAAALAAIGTAFAVESGNVVGYQNKSTPQARFMIGTVPFETTDGTMKLNKLLTGFTPVAIDWEDPTAFQTLAAELQIWNGSKYDKAYYVSNAWFDDGTEEGDYKAGWCDMDGLLRENYVIPAGNGFWIKAQSGACTLTFDNPLK